MAVFGRKSKTLNEEQATTVATPPRPGAKNRPTPKRREQEAARKQPLVVTDRKVARDTDKLKRREQQALQRQALVTGDEKHLPARDRGPVRRYVRDFVDARRSVGEFMLPVMLLVLALTFVAPKFPAAYTFIFAAVYGLIGLAAIDLFLMWRKLKGQLVTKFGPSQIPRGMAMYSVMRAFQMRRTRMPRPQNKRGAYPS